MVSIRSQTLSYVDQFARCMADIGADIETNLWYTAPDTSDALARSFQRQQNGKDILTGRRERDKRRPYGGSYTALAQNRGAMATRRSASSGATAAGVPVRIRWPSGAGAAYGNVWVAEWRRVNVSTPALRSSSEFEKVGTHGARPERQDVPISAIWAHLQKPSPPRIHLSLPFVRSEFRLCPHLDVVLYFIR
ncbi:hypothetical protein BD311DRAFT_286932 [Dichomitus squalens]|uniref:Uncharacterized protein n=1 Tax=Dichomitus squalens TaxID=114155 RepID=A0A4Q9N3T7_9APHY|nr:hypothetical protein BD311DRAFT_286932 [Dichomitus squalens]